MDICIKKCPLGFARRTFSPKNWFYVEPLKIDEFELLLNASIVAITFFEFYLYVDNAEYGVFMKDLFSNSFD